MKILLTQRILSIKLLSMSVVSCIIFLSVFLAPTIATAADLPHKGDLNAELESANKLLGEKKYLQAYDDFLKYSENNPLSQFSLGLFELYGWGRKVNHKIACEWFEKSAQEDIPMAQEFLGDCYRDGIHKSVNFERAKNWYTRAVENGLPQANCKLGKIYLSGKLINKDTRKGIRLCEKAGENGSLEAQLFLAKRFREGDEEIKQDFARALYWYKSAAVANNVEAQYHVANILYSGKSGVSDFATALKFSETSASKGYRPAYFLTAKMYMKAPLDSETKRPTAENLAKAYMWVQAVLRDTNDMNTSEEKIAATKMLKKIRTIMPKEWENNLNDEVEDHFQQLNSGKAIGH